MGCVFTEVYWNHLLNKQKAFTWNPQLIRSTYYQRLHICTISELDIANDSRKFQIRVFNTLF